MTTNIKLKRRFVIPAVIAALLVALLTGWWYYHARQIEATRLTLYGNIDIRQIDLAFNGSGRIADMRVEEGQRVRKGELLARLDTDRFEQAVVEAKAEVAAQQQVVARLKAGSRPQEIRKARADVDAARAQLTYAQSQYQRSKNLAARDVVSQSRLDNAKAQFDAAAAQLNAAQQALALTLAGPRKEDIAAASATLDALKAGLSLAETNLADASLDAPADGIIQTRILEPGDMTSPQRPAYTLALSNPIWVRAYVNETDLGRIHAGMPAEVTSDSFPGKQYAGWIGFISPTAEFTPKTVETTELRSSLVYEVRIYVCNPQNQLRLGMPVTATVLLDSKAHTTQACKSAA
ncbi:MAG TPA: efflux RND transporter periplasmic adaptor subunit [Gammaproteobacteria bacterium]|nr:efflux RND transporter periplasmic adaptor subunit [Gammaproteobacteria bacterium]